MSNFENGLTKFLMSFNHERQLNPDDFQFIKRVSGTEIRLIDLFIEKKTQKNYYGITFIKHSINGNSRDKFISRFEKIRQLNHPAIYTPIGFFMPNSDKIICQTLIFENKINGVLAYYLEKSILRAPKTVLDTSTVMKILVGVASGLNYLHSNGFICGDLQPSSIFLNENYEPAIIAAFSTSNIYNITKVKTMDIATDIISPPEVLNGEADKLSPSSDIYAFAILVFRFVCKKMLFHGSDVSLSFYDNIVKGNRFLIPQYCYTFLREIIEKCWSQDPKDRPIISDVYMKLLKDIPLYLALNIKEKYTEYVNDLHYFESKNANKNSKGKKNDNNTFTADFTSNVFGVDQLKSSEAYKYIEENPNFSSHDKKYFKHILKLQNRIIDLYPSNFMSNVDWIKKNIEWDSATSLNLISRTILLAVMIRWRDIGTYANLFKILVVKPKRQRLKQLFLVELFNQLSIYEPFPKMNAVLLFLRNLVDCRCYNPKDIVWSIDSFYKTMAKVKRNACLLFAYFADHIFKLNNQLYQKLSQLYESYQDNPFFPKPYQKFYKDLKDVFEKDWNTYLNVLYSVKGSKGLVTEIIHDDIASFLESQTVDDDFVHLKIESNIFEPCHVLGYRPNVTMYCAAYSANRIFNKMVQFANFYGVKDDNGHRVGFFTGASGCIGIYNIVSSTYANTNDILIGAISFHQHIIAQKQFNREKSDPSLPDNFGNYAFVAAATYNNLFGMINLILKKVDPNVEENFSRVALHAAAENGHLEVLSYIIAECPNSINFQNLFGQTALHIAIEHGHINCAEKLIKSKKIDLNVQDDKGFSPLFCAIEHKCTSIVKMLIENQSCNVNLQNKKGKTPLHWAAKHSTKEIVTLLLTRSDINGDIQDMKGKKAADFFSLVSLKKSKLSEFHCTAETFEKTNCRI